MFFFLEASTMARTMPITATGTTKQTKINNSQVPIILFYLSLSRSSLLNFRHSSGLTCLGSLHSPIWASLASFSASASAFSSENRL